MNILLKQPPQKTGIRWKNPPAVHECHGLLLQPLLVWLWKGGQLERADEMEKFQRRKTCTQTIIGDFCHPEKAHDQLPVRA